MKVVPASGERDKQGRKIRAPKKYDGAFSLNKVTQKESIAFVLWLVEENERKYTEKVASKEMSMRTAGKILNHFRTLRRLVKNLKETDFEEAILPPVSEDKQGYLF